MQAIFAKKEIKIPLLETELGGRFAFLTIPKAL